MDSGNDWDILNIVTVNSSLKRYCEQWTMKTLWQIFCRLRLCFCGRLSPGLSREHSNNCYLQTAISRIEQWTQWQRTTSDGWDIMNCHEQLLTAEIAADWVVTAGVCGFNRLSTSASVSTAVNWVVTVGFSGLLFVGVTMEQTGYLRLWQWSDNGADCRLWLFATVTMEQTNSPKS